MKIKMFLKDDYEKFYEMEIVDKDRFFSFLSMSNCFSPSIQPIVIVAKEDEEVYCKNYYIYYHGSLEQFYRRIKENQENFAFSLELSVKKMGQEEPFLKFDSNSYMVAIWNPAKANVLYEAIDKYIDRVKTPDGDLLVDVVIRDLDSGETYDSFSFIAWTVDTAEVFDEFISLVVNEVIMEFMSYYK